MISFVNYYGVEKTIFFDKRQKVFLIPNEYKEGEYKFKDLKCLEYSGDDFFKLSQTEREDILSKYMIWVCYGDSIFNGFNRILINNVDDLEISYVKVEDKKSGVLAKIKNSKNEDDFFEYIVDTNIILSDILDECSEILYDEVKNIFENNKFGGKVRKIFFDYYGDGETISIGVTMATLKDIFKLFKKYNFTDYKNEVQNLFLSLLSYPIYIKRISSNSGDYHDNRFEIENLDRISSYYCSFLEQGIRLSCNGEYDDNNFLYLICNRVLKYIEKDKDNYNISGNCDLKIDAVD